MGKKKARGEYNDFLDGEKLRDNADIRTTLGASSADTRNISPPPTRQERKDQARGKKSQKGGPKKPHLTHFLCLPLVNEESRPQFEKNLDKFKEELEHEGIIPLKAVRPVGTLHLTLGVMSLDETKLEEAEQCLQELDLQGLLRDITAANLAQKAAEEGAVSETMNAGAFPDSQALEIDIRGLVPMHSPHKTSVLYGEPRDESLRLQAFGEALKAHFTENGLLIEDKRALKLHATIVNTIYAKKGGRRSLQSVKGKDGRQQREIVETMSAPREDAGKASVAGSLNSESKFDDRTAKTDPTTAETETLASGPANKAAGRGDDIWMRFDARSLIDKYHEFAWAQNVRINSVQICKMGARKIWSGEIEGEGEVIGEEYEAVARKNI